MANQYFENNDKLERNPKKITFYSQGNTFTFTTDNGIFSKDSVDFGSNLLLKTLIANRVIMPKSEILDVGCGYGPIGITLAKMSVDSVVTMVDVNKYALELTARNAVNNGVNNVIIKESFAYQNINSTYDIIVTNPPIRAGKQVVHQILGESIEYLKHNGSLWCVIQKKQGAASAIKLLKTKYSNVEIVSIEKGYCIIVAKNDNNN